MNQNQFEMIIRKMEQRYGKMRKGDEEKHAMILFPMESNLLKVYRQYPASNSRRLKEAVCLVFHRINGYLSGEQADISKFEDEDNIRLRDALLYAFDPFSNAEVKEILQMDLNDREVLTEYFKESVQCIRRIYDSIEYWEKSAGNNGYFEFVESYMGEKIPRDNKLDYAILLGAEALPNAIGG